MSSCRYHPLQAGLGWVVSWDKGPFRGREPLEKERETGPWRRLRGLLAEVADRPVTVTRSSSVASRAGVVTSGNFPPCSSGGIALAFLPPETALGAEVEIALRGGSAPAVVVKPPFQRLTVTSNGDGSAQPHQAGSSGGANK